MMEEINQVVAAYTSNENALSEKPPQLQAKSALRKRTKMQMQRIIIDTLLWCVLAVLIVIGRKNAGILEQYSSVSLRYETPVSGQTAYDARRYAIEQEGSEVFWPTFWHEGNARFSAEFTETTADCILLSGDAALVWPAEYLFGEAPGTLDDVGCAVSSRLSGELWGGMDVVGKTVEVDGEVRIVRGVFEGEELLAILSVRDENKSHSFTAVELSGGISSPDRSDIETFAVSAGLGKPDNILIGTPAFIAAVVAILPLCILAFYGIILCVSRLKRCSSIVRGAVMLAAFLCSAFLLPVLLEAMPERMIPTRWSDFSFWGALVDQINGDLYEYYTLTPHLRDVMCKILFFKQIIIAFFSTGIALSVCLRWQGKLQNEMILQRSNHGRYNTGKH